MFREKPKVMNPDYRVCAYCSDGFRVLCCISACNGGGVLKKGRARASTSHAVREKVWAARGRRCGPRHLTAVRGGGVGRAT
jgi:hypothetical protein